MGELVIMWTTCVLTACRTSQTPKVFWAPATLPAQPCSSTPPPFRTDTSAFLWPPGISLLFQSALTIKHPFQYCSEKYSSGEKYTNMSRETSLSAPNVLSWGMVSNSFCVKFWLVFGFFLIYFTCGRLRHIHASNNDALLIQTRVQFTCQTIWDLPSVLPEFDKFNNVNRFFFFTVWEKKYAKHDFQYNMNWLNLVFTFEQSFPVKPMKL